VRSRIASPDNLLGPLLQGLDLLQEKLNIEGTKCLRLSGKRRGEKQEKQESWNS